MDLDRAFLLMAFEEAEKAMSLGTYPIGAVVVDPTGQVVGRGHNRVFLTGDVTAHAEVDAMRSAGAAFLNMDTKRYLPRRLTVYSTCEPCPMCAHTILMANVKRIVWAANDDEIGAVRLLKEGPHFQDRWSKLEVTASPYSDLEERQRKMLAEFNIARGFLDTPWQHQIQR